MIRHALAVLTLSAVFAHAALAQKPADLKPDTAALVEITLADGSVLAGRVVALTDTSLVLLTPAGARVEVPKRTVVRWHAVRGAVVAGRIWRRDPNVSRLFFAPTARTLPRGDGYFGDYYLFLASGAVGVTDWFTFSAGMSLIPGVKLGDQMYFVAPKVRVLRQGLLTVSGGLMYSAIAISSGGGSGGIGYGVATLGSEDHSVTLGLGWPFVVGHGGTTEPWILAGGDTRIASRVKLVAELWKFPGTSDIPAIFGLRFFGESLAVDFGFLRVFGEDMGSWPFIPYVDFAVHF